MSNTAESTRQKLIVQDDSAVANLMDTGRFEHMFRIAGAMSAASLIPEHLLGAKKNGTLTAYTPEQVKANCFLIVNQSLRWGLDPFAVMPETYVVGGKLAYQGKLIAAVVNARADLDGRLAYTFTGKIGADDLTVTVSGKFRGSPKPSEVTLSVGQAKTANEMWRKDPEQKLIYSGVVKWARRYCPEIVLGIISDDDADAIEMRDATPRPAPTAAAGNPWKEEKPAAIVDATPAPVIDGKAEVSPTRDELRDALLAGIKSRGRKNSEALAIFREAKLLDKPAMSDATDAELAGMVDALHLLDKPAEEPAAAAEQEAPADERTAAQRKDDALAAIEEQLLEFDGVDISKFAGMCREQKLIGSTQALRALGFEKLENIAGSVAHIIKTAGEGGAQ